MADKKTEKEIRKIIRKYGGECSRDILLSAGFLSGGTVAFGVLMDLAMTGGLFSIGTAIFGAFGGTAALLGTGAAINNSIARDYVNAAGQTIRSTPQVYDTLQEMQERLQSAFKRAATPKKKEQFLHLAAEIEQDARKLSPAFKIVAGSPKGHGTDDYTFIVDTDEETTLAEAILKLSQPAPQKPGKPEKSALEERVRELEKQIEELKNPRITRLDKNPNTPPPP